MRILVISNFYPPHYIGGYELGCKDVVEGLQARGHDVKVLTSTYGLRKRQVDGNVFRWLRHDLDGSGLLSLVQKEWVNQRAMRRLLRLVKPDLVYIWNLRFISVSLAVIAENIAKEVSYFVSDSWFTEFIVKGDQWFQPWSRKSQRVSARILKPLVIRVLRGLGILTTYDLRQPLDVQFASRFLLESSLEAKIDMQSGAVIHWGIDTTNFPQAARFPQMPLRLLYVGQVVPHKGVHTAIEAVKLLHDEGEMYPVMLDIVGGSVAPDYVSQLKESICASHLDEVVHLHGSVPREHLPGYYQAHDILLFTSIWAEPFSITLLEAMSSGLAVVGTSTGGTGEILQDGVNALVFQPNDAYTCAQLIKSLLKSPELFQRLQHDAKQTVEGGFKLQDMIAAIEENLLKVLSESGCPSKI